MKVYLLPNLTIGCLKFLALAFYILLLSNHRSAAQQSARSSIYMAHDNDFLKITNSTDRYYSFGIIAGFQKTLKLQKVRFLPSRYFKDPKNTYIGGLGISIKGYTPSQDTDRRSRTIERPFAGTFTFRPYIISVSRLRLIRVDFEAGTRGPASHAGDIQNWVHNKIGDDPVGNWEDQLDNKVLLNIYALYAKPFSIFKGFEIIPESSVALGNHFTYIQQGITFRLGLFNDISNSLSYYTYSNDKVGNAFEVFALFNLYGRWSLVDATLGRLDATMDDASVIYMERSMGGFQLTLNLLYNHLGLTAAYHKTTPSTFFNDKHSYGTIAIIYNW